MPSNDRLHLFTGPACFDSTLCIFCTQWLSWASLSACFLFLHSGIPLLCFLVLLPLNIPWSQISVTWLGVVHFLACLSPQLGSVVYHLFMNHEGGEPVYKTLLTLDMCGICMINTLGQHLTLDHCLINPSTPSHYLLVHLSDSVPMLIQVLPPTPYIWSFCIGCSWGQ